MYKIVQVRGRRYKVDVERFAEFCAAVTCGLLAATAFVFFFGYCWGGFLR